MNTFANAVKNQDARTANGMKARASTANSLVDLFFKIGASRGKDITAPFTAAYVENPDKALRIAAWARDVRQGAGERKLFRDILNLVSPKDAKRLLAVVPELGRWDDLLEVKDPEARAIAFTMIRQALDAGDGLCAKWMPRKGDTAVELRRFLGWTPKFYRKRLVELTKVVESQMCANDWDDINFNHVPSVAASRYKKAFYRHTPKFEEYVKSLVKGEKGVKVNSGAVYPYDVLKGIISPYGYTSYNRTELDHVKAQWDALPNFVGENASILPIVDVSGSMSAKAGGYASKSQVSCLDVSVSLGLYLADKNTGPFKDTFLTFSAKPQLVTLHGDILQKINQMVKVQWDMNTNLVAAMEKILSVAKNGNVAAAEMPKTLLILSDMQFDQCARFDDSAMEMIRRKFTTAGYEVPQVVFWNLNAHDNAPVKFNEQGVALVSGFSPSIMKSILAADLDGFSPEAIMDKTIMQDRYKV